MYLFAILKIIYKDLQTHNLIIIIIFQNIRFWLMSNYYFNNNHHFPITIKQSNIWFTNSQITFKDNILDFV